MSKAVNLGASETEAMHDVCRFIDDISGDDVRLDDLAARAGMSRYHFARRFKAVVGVTPGHYLQASRMRRLKAQLRTAPDISRAVYDAGFGSASAVYERVDSHLGMTPAQYRAGGDGVAISYATLETPAGLMMIGATDRGVCFVQFDETETALLERLRSEYPRASISPRSNDLQPEFAAWCEAIERHMSGGQPHLELPLDVRATGFQLRVWQYLRTIPYGDVRSYAESRRRNRCAERGARGRKRVREKRRGDRHSLPSRNSRNGPPGRVPLGTRKKTRAPRSRARLRRGLIAPPFGHNDPEAPRLIGVDLHFGDQDVPASSRQHSGIELHSREFLAAGSVRQCGERVARAFSEMYGASAFVTIVDEQDERRILAVASPNPEILQTLTGQVGRVHVQVSGALQVSAASAFHTRLRRLGVVDIVEVPLTTADRSVGAIVMLRTRCTPTLELLNSDAFKALAGYSAVALSRQIDYERNRRVADAFQRSALAELPAVPGFRFDALYEAGRADAQVGGDWYDAFRVLDGRIVVTIGDAMGSGLNAAVIMASVRQAIRAVAYIRPDPFAILLAADRTVANQFRDRYVTAFVGIIDPVTHHFTYANAGHPPPLLRAPLGHVVELRSRGVPLGLAEIGAEFEVRQLTIEPQSVFVLYTDGLIESTRDICEGERTLRGVVEALQVESATLAADIHGRVLREHSRDDVAILTIAFDETIPRKRWRFDPFWQDATARVRAELTAVLALEHPIDEARLFALHVIVAEIVGNLLRHAPGMAEIVLEPALENIIIHVLDRGPGYEYHAHLPPDIFSEGGRGLFLISQLARDFTVEHRPGGGSHARITI